MSHTMRGRAVAAAALAVGSLVLAPLTAQAAIAAKGPTTDHLKADNYVLHIHKHESASPTGKVASPKGTGEVAGAAIKDVTFEVFQFTDLDLDKNADWAKIKALKPTQDACDMAKKGNALGHTVTSKGEKVTDDQGVIDYAFGNDGAAAYLVCETKAPADVVRLADPFVITLPFPHEGEWLSDVHAYPKNTRSRVSKSIKQQVEYGIGATVEFPVSATFGGLGDDERYTVIQIADPMPAQLEAQGAKELKIAGQVAETTDYKVGVNAEKNTVVVTLTPAGLKKFPAAGGEVEVTFTAKAKQAGTATNVARIFSKTAKVPGGPEVEIPEEPNPPVDPDKPVVPEGPTPPGTPTNEVTTHWGKLTITKHDSVQTAKGLEGAEFEIYAAKTPYPASEAECGKNLAENAQKIAVNGQTNFTTKAGKVDVEGLFVSDSVNDKVDATFRCYVLKEVKAPHGYVLPSDALTPVAIKADTETPVEIDIKNTQELIPGLPLTGADGRLIALTLGGAVALVGAGTVVVAMRRREARQ